MNIELISKYNIKDTVYFMENNKIRKSTIKSISFPQIFVTKGKTTETGFTYRITRKSHLQEGNSQGMPQCWLFASRKELIKTL